MAHRCSRVVAAYHVAQVNTQGGATNVSSVDSAVLLNTIVMLCNGKASRVSKLSTTIKVAPVRIIKHRLCSLEANRVLLKMATALSSPSRAPDPNTTRSWDVWSNEIVA